MPAFLLSYKQCFQEEVWKKADDIVRRISPAHDTRHARIVFDDVMRLFRGEYPGFCPIGTLYHNMQHTLDVFLCAVRLMHGVHISGTRLADDEITMIMMAALMHDVGYAQRAGEESGTGAQFTQSHVNRSIEFMQQYIVEKHLPAVYAAPLKHIILCTNPTMGIADIQFSDEHTTMLGKILGTADLIGQMADRNYLEKLLFLRLEFEEAHIGNDQNIHDLLRNTQLFYETTKLRLREQFDSIGAKLSFYFKDWYGVENNYYLESIEKNISYLARITALNDETHLSMLKRGGIVNKLSHG
jgi:HD superfamily phosphodiesterase